MLAPMPSAHYPATAIYWPISAAISTIYATGGILYMYAEIWQWALYAFIAISALYVITQLTSLPISVAAFVAGLATIPHMQVTMLIGALTGKFILKKLIFKEKWEEYKPTLAAGIGIGEAMMLLICAALGLVIKSLYYLPY